MNGKDDIVEGKVMVEEANCYLCAGLTSNQPGGSEKSQSTLALPHRPLNLDLILLFAACSTIGMHGCKVAATLCSTQAPNKLRRR